MATANQPPTVGIVIPAYNEESTIRACVLAALGQTVPANEIIVVDNMSTDLTSSILAELKATFPDAPLIILRQDAEQGITPTRNMGFDAVTSDVIGRIDSDSVLEPNWVECTMKVFLDSSIDAATGPVIYYDMPLRRYMALADDSARRAISRLVKQYRFLLVPTWRFAGARGKRCAARSVLTQTSTCSKTSTSPSTSTTKVSRLFMRRKWSSGCPQDVSMIPPKISSPT